MLNAHLNNGKCRRCHRAYFVLFLISIRVFGYAARLRTISRISIYFDAFHLRFHFLQAPIFLTRRTNR